VWPLDLGVYRSRKVVSVSLLHFRAASAQS
jgi:hypothetical protein